jgi:poly(A)-specific ribonuclease
MDVTNKTLRKLFPAIKAAIAEADFIAIDCELTGLNGAQSFDKLEFLDSIQDRYLKVRTSATSFQLIQFGLCTFQWSSFHRAYVAKPFNAYIFPKPSSSSLGFNPTFLCQASSLQFLRTHKFDFNAWINDGIPYVSRAQEEVILERIRKTGGEIPMDESNFEFIESYT